MNIMGISILTLVHTDESKDALRMYEEIWNKIKDFIGSTCNS